MTSHVARGALGASQASLHVSSETWMMAECESVVSLLLSHRLEASCFTVCKCRARLAERVVLVRRPDNPYDNNYLDVRVAYHSCWVV